MKRIINYTKQYWYYYLFGTVALIGSIYLDMHSPIITGRLIDEVILAKDTSIFSTLIWMLIGITAGRAVLGYIKEMSFDIAGADIIRDLRQNLFDHIQEMSQDFFEERNTGELMARLKDDCDKISHGISFGIMLLIEMVITFVTVVILMLNISIPLSIITFCALPFILFFARRLDKEIDHVYGKISEKNAELNTTAQENIAGVRLVKAFAREKHEVKKFLKQNKEYNDLNMAYAKGLARNFPNIEMISNLIPVLVIVLGAYFVIDNSMTLGELAKFLGYAYIIVTPVRMLGWLSSIMAEAKGAIKKVDTVFNAKANIVDPVNPLELTECRGHVTFKNVGLTFGEKEVLKDISFDVKPGQTLAIMGSTGSGKSSIVNLLERFYDPTEGNVLIDGYNIKEMSRNTLRAKISVIMQEVFLFSDSILNNIHFDYGKNLSLENVTESASAAQAHDFISRMEEDYHTVIGEKGIGLSGGQKQRISIARAFAKKANILVMDDATSALDMETEHDIQAEIKKRTHVTKIIIAHRISAVKDADEILIIEDGRIVERGTHKMLLKEKGRYYETFNEQYEGYIA